jgi:hypothetical protein
MTKPWTPGKGPKTRRMAEARLRELLLHQSHGDDTRFLDVARRAIPDAWLTLEMDLDVAEPKDKVTLYLDRPVAKMFRAMGGGYQARINRILETWMQAKMSGHIERELTMLNAIDISAREREAGDAGSEVKRKREALHEHWAYNQGLMDGSRFADLVAETEALAE